MSTKVFVRLIFILLALSSFSILFFGCKGGGEPSGNILPITRLANVPPEGFISDNPRLTLYWVGDDPDGFVIGFRYTWTYVFSPDSIAKKPYSTILNIGIIKEGTENFALMTNATPENLPAVYHYFATLPPEGLDPDSANKLDAGLMLTIEGSSVWASNPSGVRYPVHQNPNSGTFIFDSQDILNPHTFEVAAIDNTGELDDEPAKLNFSTPQVDPPNATIVSGPAPTDTVLVRLNATDSFIGIPFTFRGVDPNSRTIDYSWVVDKDVWASQPGRTVPWSEFTQTASASITGSVFPPESLYATKHTMYLRSRNEFGSIDTTYSEWNFNTLYPEFLKPNFERRTLLLNASYNYKDSVGYIYPNKDTLENFYRSIFDAMGRNGKYDFVKATGDPQYFPGLGILGKYSTVYFMGDVIRQTHGFTGNLEGSATLQRYVDVGGKMVITAYAMPADAYGESFMRYVPHIDENRIRAGGTSYAFIGATGDKGYPDISLDYTKIDTSWHNPGFPLGLRNMYAGRPSGFGEIIYRWHDNGGPGGSYEGRTVGVRYIGLTYQVIYFGFPLYYCEKPVVLQILIKAFQEIGY